MGFLEGVDVLLFCHIVLLMTIIFRASPMPQRINYITRAFFLEENDY
jgi:hypothetical protein